MSAVNREQLQTDGQILVVDDNQRLAGSIQGLLRVYGYRADIAYDGQTAVKMLHQNDYDVVLLDLAMPALDGHEVLLLIQEAGMRTLPIVISGETSFNDVSKALRRGAHDYLKKPYANEELMTTVSNAMGKQRLEQSHDRIQQRLSVSEKLHRFLVDHSPDIIFILDEHGRFSFVNHKIESLLHYPRGELIGEPFLSIVEQADQEKARYFLDSAHKLDDIQPCINLDLVSRQANANRRHFEISLSRVGQEARLQKGMNHRFDIYGTARDITEQIEAEAFISFQAYHDILTRLPNRSLFRDRVNMAINQAQRQSQKLAIMFIDLDRFKVINDSLGHTLGDRLLQAVSRRLKSNIRKVDTLSRFGGDEFTLLLPDIQDGEAATHVATKILDALKQPFELTGHEIHIGASIGIALYPESGENLETLIKHADIAMYRVKNTGKNGSFVFNQDVSGDISRRHALEQDLRKALNNDEICIHYQPLVDIRSGKLHAVEALIRWDHPKFGQLSPTEFIPIAEDSRLIIDIDRQTLRKACEHVVELRKGAHPDLKLSVNLSALVVEQSDFIEHVSETLRSTGFPAHCLELEITEGILLNDHLDTVEKLVTLTGTGVSLAIDDFGTGFSSLSYLQKFPVDTLKIDRSFIQRLHSNTEDACIISAIVSMARGLKINIVAEGVEHETQLDYLRSLGCNIVQGNYFGAAAPLEELALSYPLTRPLDKPIVS